MDIYGKVDGDGKRISESDMGVTDPLNLHSCYGESKRMGETWCSVFAHEYAVPTRMVRIAHTYGPTMDVEHDPRVFASFVKNIHDDENIYMHSDGSALRPFCYLADACSAFLLVLLSGENGEAYNITNMDQFLSMGELADILVGLYPAKGLKVIYDDVKPAGYLENKANKGNCYSNTKLQELGWEPKIDVREGFSRVLRYLQDSE